MAISAIIPDIREHPGRGDRVTEKNLISVSNNCGGCSYCSSCECIECESNTSLDSRQRNKNGDGCQFYTRCQIRRHNTVHSAWLVAGDKIYDATEYLSQHPGGEYSILKKAGGACDCTEDFQFHSKSGRKVWEKYFVGRVKPCPGSPEARQWWMFWM